MEEARKCSLSPHDQVLWEVVAVPGLDLLLLRQEEEMPELEAEEDALQSREKEVLVEELSSGEVSEHPEMAEAH